MALMTDPIPRVFIDSSILIAAAISAKGSARDLILCSMRGKLTLYISTLVLEETARNLARKAPVALPAFETLRGLLTNIVDPDTPLVVRVAEVVEAKDAPIVAAAIKAEVTYLASYDQKHLLRQGDVIQIKFGITVVTPDQALRVIP